MNLSIMKVEAVVFGVMQMVMINEIESGETLLRH